jgi:CRP-like cAMP-binding protein
MTDFLDAKRKEIRDRLAELRPLVDEFRRLEAAEQALSGLDEPRAERASKPARRRSASASSRGSSSRRGRPKGGGTRSKQALELVRARPGITIPELAEAMDIKQNYLYRVMPSLAEEGLVHKSGRGWHVRLGAAAAADGNGSGDGNGNGSTEE